MSVLIKGMDMPKNCCGCPCGRVDGATKDPMNNEIFSMFCMAKKDYWTCYRTLSGKPTWCPLVEVETPHGDLVDKQKLLKAWTDLEDVSDKIKDPHDVEVAISEQTCDVLLDAPTVIEAEE